MANTNGLKLPLILLLSCILSITADPVSYNCPDPSNSSTYLANRDLLLSSLSSNSNSPPGGFYNTGIGDDPDEVFGLFLCRGDITSQDCQTCVTTAIQGIKSLCSNSIAAILWYDDCMIRYTDHFIYAILKQEPVYYPKGPANITNLDQYNQTVRDLMLQLVQHAAYDSTTPMYYAADKVKYYTGSDTVYGQVQCTPDITKDECSYCLKQGIELDIQPKLYPSQGGRILKPSCNLRYEFNSPFYNQA